MKQKNNGLRKLCDCDRKRWSECVHSWYVNFKWKDQHYRFSLDKELSTHVDSKSEAEKYAEEFRVQIRAGRFRVKPEPEVPVKETLTLVKMMDQYRTQHLVVQRPTT